MMQAPFLSIVIPTYNRANLICETIESILKQTNQDFEIIIIDDGSTDNTEEVIQKYLSENVSYEKFENAERAVSRNRGTRKALGKYVNWFDSDDIMLPHHVQTIKSLSEKYDSPEIITTHFSVFNRKENKLILQKKFNQFSVKCDPLIHGNYLACNPVAVRKDVAQQNPFNENRKLSASEDYELWLRLRAKFPFIQSEDVTSYLVQHSQRSVLTMHNATILENRFLTFLDLTTKNKEIITFLGTNLNYFKMVNFSILAVDLAVNGHKNKAIKYLWKGFQAKSKIVTTRIFWATIKHILLK